MADFPSTLNHRTNGSVQIAIADHVRAQAEIAAGIPGDHIGPRHAAALRAFAEYMAGLKPSDERVYALSVLSTLTESGYEPGLEQRSLLARLAVERQPPQVEATCNELVAAAADDFRQAREEENGWLKGELAEVEETKLKAAEYLELAQKAERRASDLDSELEAANAALSEQAAQLEHLRGMLGTPNGNGSSAGDEDAAAKSKAKGKPRRVLVEGQTGIYERQSAKGVTEYEISYYDDDRKRRWLMVGPDLEEAIATREKLTEPLEAVA
jgi:hypothetical protein